MPSVPFPCVRAKLCLIELNILMEISIHCSPCYRLQSADFLEAFVESEQIKFPCLFDPKDVPNFKKPHQRWLGIVLAYIGFISYVITQYFSWIAINPNYYCTELFCSNCCNIGASLMLFPFRLLYYV